MAAKPQIEHNEAVIKQAIEAYEKEILSGYNPPPKRKTIEEIQSEMDKFAPFRNKLMAQSEKLQQLPNYKDSEHFIQILNTGRNLLQEIAQIDKSDDMRAIYLKQIKNQNNIIDKLVICYCEYYRKQLETKGHVMMSDIKKKVETTMEFLKKPASKKDSKDYLENVAKIFRIFTEEMGKQQTSQTTPMKS